MKPPILKLLPLSSIAVKLSTLFIRQISKPIANLIKAEAKNHPGFKRFCVRVAQNIHFFDNRLKEKLLGHSMRPIRPLNEARAIANGANFLSEAFIFSVGSGALLLETNRQRQKEKNRREAVADDIAMLQEEIEGIKKQLADYSIKIDDYRAPANYKPFVLRIAEDGTVLPGTNNHKEGDSDYQSLRKSVGQDMKQLNDNPGETVGSSDSTMASNIKFV
ncbi:hypothetical protein FOA43_003744 [Brettanomyces nanus]|uniref:OPA3-like protein n=1 Tax=Eeniella nana TaxID=13502 RepID=A0A875S4Y6_EENNA|nr:uncharacterized protein FOA43_003744 [Brettanomyces nanus]QPG76356.1 hypothetical protein FOA43_003744 [Brettanomyces nanus]